MKPLPIVLLLACLLIGLFVLLLRLPEPQIRLVLTPATCAALVPLGLPLPTAPGGCLYTGPVRRDFHSVGLGEIWVPRSAVLVEAPQSEGNKP